MHKMRMMAMSKMRNKVEMAMEARGDNNMQEGVGRTGLGRMQMGNNVLSALFNRPQLSKRRQIMMIGKQWQLQELLSWKVKKSQSQGGGWRC